MYGTMYGTNLSHCRVLRNLRRVNAFASLSSSLSSSPCSTSRFLSSRTLVPGKVTAAWRRRQARNGSRAPMLGIDAAGDKRSGAASVRGYSTAADDAPPHPQSVAVLGGGLTGLTTAYYMSRYMPNTKITIYESSKRLGGWIDTEKVTVTTPDGTKGTVYFERGARAVQAQNMKPVYDDLIFYHLVSELNLLDELRFAHKDDHIAKFIYYPDHIVDVSPPRITDLSDPVGTVRSWAGFIGRILTEKLFAGKLDALLKWMEGYDNSGKFRDQLVINSKRPGQEGAPDFAFKFYHLDTSTKRFFYKQELSVGEYFKNRLGREPVDNLLSAMAHGIYGGDVWKLSFFSSIFARASEPPNPDKNMVWISQHDQALLVEMEGLHNNEYKEAAIASMKADFMWFQKGFCTLTNAMALKLRKNPNVTIRTGDAVESIRRDAQDRMAICTRKSPVPKFYDKVVSTLYSKTLASLTDDKLPSLATAHAVTIQLVNVWYPTPGLHKPHTGFGYLIPQSVPYEQNPEGALGVIFDSCREDGFSTKDEGGPPIKGYPGGADTVPGSKFTVMLGGHLWDNMPQDWWPDSVKAGEMAKAVLARHLNIPQSETDRAVVSSKVCRECIPQHYVGHRHRMMNAHYELESAFDGKLAVAGGSYQHPGVMGSLRAGRDIAAEVAGLQTHFKAKYIEIDQEKNNENGLKIIKENTVGRTGLARFARAWLLSLVPKSQDLKYRYNQTTLSSTPVHVWWTKWTIDLTIPEGEWAEVTDPQTLERRRNS